MRSGYADDIDGQELATWRGRVASAIRGKRGQKLLRDALAAMDAMPVKELVRDELVTEEGGVCLLGAVGKARAVEDIDKIDPEEHDVLAERFDVSTCLIQEIEYINDEYGAYDETPEVRWTRVRKWVVKQLSSAPQS